MANILLTSVCNRSCPYCFAESEMAATPVAGRYLSWDNLVYIADFLKSGGQPHVSLLGGEPTMHPDCVDYVLYLIERGFVVTIFTNGILSSARLEQFEKHLTRIPVGQLHLLCNLHDPVLTPASAQEVEKVHDFLSMMGPWTSPGFNIYRTDFALDFLFDAINRYGLKRYVRIGLTQPIPGKANAFIRPDQIRDVVARIFSFRDQFIASRVKPGFDCGFPICRFSDEEIGWMHRHGAHPQFACGPAFDIAPDMSVYHCFPLSSYDRKSLFDFDSLEQIEAHFNVMRAPVKCEVAGIFKECDGCRQQEDGVCMGGGLCHAVSRFVQEASIRLPEIEHEVAKIRLSR